MQNIAMANSLKLRGYDFRFSWGNGAHSRNGGHTELAEEMIWLWRDTGDRVRMAAHAEATFWYVLPSLPMFLLIPALLRAGAPFWLALGAGVLLTAALYLLTTAVLARFGVRL